MPWSSPTEGRGARAASLTLLVFLCLLVRGGPPARAAAFADPAFESVTLASGLDFPTTVAWATGGRMFIAEKNGYVRLVRPDGTLTPNPIVDIHDHVVNSGDRGLLGLAVAPIAGSGDVRLYLLYSHGAPATTKDQAADASLMWVTVHSDSTVVGGSGGVDPTETTVLGSETTAPNSTLSDAANGCVAETDNCIPSEGYTHSIGTVLVDPSDGSLWVGTGDGYNDGAYVDNASAPFHLRSQDVQSLAGKILHVHPDGTGYQQSPFCPTDTNLNDNCTKVWAAGLRNPFRFTLRSSGRAIVPIGGDVGEGNWEELDDMPAGFNGGWPCYEGNDAASESVYMSSAQCTRLGANYSHPFFLFDHYLNGVQTGAAIVGGPVYSGSTYPASYLGQVFHTDYVHGWIDFRSLSDNVDAIQATHTLLSGSVSGNGTPFVSLVQAPDGNLVAVQIYGDPTNPGPASGSVSEIRYAPTDKSPVARATANASCFNTTTTAPVSFTGDGSTDPDGDTQLSYHWDFGDGSSSTQADPQHTYAVGVWEARLVVTDSAGLSNNAFLTLRVGPGDTPPNASISTPAPGDQYLAGTQITLSGGTTSGAGVEMSWEPVLDHAGTHTHVLGDIVTPSGDVPDAANGVPAFLADSFHGADSHYILRFTVSKNGCATTMTQTMFPQTGAYDMFAVDQTNGGAPIAVPLTFAHTSIPDTGPAPHLVTAVAKNAFGVASAPPTWINGGYTYTFDHWVAHDSHGDTTYTTSDQTVRPYSRDQTDIPESITAYYNRSDRPPVATITSPGDGSTVVTGQTVTPVGTVVDPEDGAQQASSLNWTVMRRVNGVATSTAFGGGASPSFVADGGGDPNATYAITLTGGADSHGVAAVPATVTIHVVTPAPPGPGAGPGSGPSGGPPGTGSGPGSGSGAKSPTANLARVRGRRVRSLDGAVSDPLRVTGVLVAIRPQRVRGHGCVWWSVRRRRLVHVRRGCSATRWLVARLHPPRGGSTGWTLTLGGALPKGRYVVVLRARDSAGRVITGFGANATATLVVS